MIAMLDLNTLELNEIEDSSRESLFLKKLIEKENSTQLLEIRFKDISFVNIDKIEIFKRRYKVCKCAYLSINNQIKVKGRGFEDLTDDLKIKIYNQVLQSDRLKNKLANAIIIEDEVKAIMVGGDDERSFQYIKTSSIIHTIKTYLTNNGYGYDFLTGTEDDYVSIVRYKINGIYHHKYNAAVDIITSISGHSSIKLVPIIYSRDSEMELTKDAIIIEHKGFPINRVKDNLPYLIDCFSLYFSKFKTFEDDVFENKDSVIEDICFNAGLNKRTRNFILNNFNGITIKDFLNFLQEIEFRGSKGEDKEVILGRILNIISN